MKKRTSIIAVLLTVCATASCTMSALSTTASATWLRSANTTCQFYDKAWRNDSADSTVRDLRGYGSHAQYGIICSGKARYTDNVGTDKTTCGISSSTGWERYTYDQTNNVFGPTTSVSSFGSWTPSRNYYSGNNLTWRGYVQV